MSHGTMSMEPGEYAQSSNGRCGFHQGNILVLDHRFHTTRALVASLEERGFSITARSDRQEALSLVDDRSDCFDLVITDENMRSMTHSGAFKKVLELRPDMPAILCTENNWAIFCKKLQLIRQATFLTEPTDFSQTIGAIGSLPGSCHAEQRRMLVVSDHFPMTRVISRILKRFHFEAVCSADCRNRWETAREKKNCFDLVITDQNFKDMTDSRVLREIIAAHPEVPVMLCTRDHKAIHLSRIEALEAMEFLTRQAHFQELFHKIAALLNWSHFWNLCELG